VTQIVMEQEVQ